MSDTIIVPGTAPADPKARSLLVDEPLTHRHLDLRLATEPRGPIDRVLCWFSDRPRLEVAVVTVIGLTLIAFTLWGAL